MQHSLRPNADFAESCAFRRHHLFLIICLSLNSIATQPTIYGAVSCSHPRRVASFSCKDADRAVIEVSPKSQHYW
jgi:hypothetical protein